MGTLTQRGGGIRRDLSSPYLYGALGDLSIEAKTRWGSMSPSGLYEFTTIGLRTAR